MSAGGEDGAVKVLDVFYKRHRCSSNPQKDASIWSFHGPYAKVIQTLPSHESSVGALAVGTHGSGSDSDNSLGTEARLKSTLVVSGGGKLEVRAWCVEGVNGGSGNKKGDCYREGKATFAPPVRRRLLLLLTLPLRFANRCCSVSWPFFRVGTVAIPPATAAVQRIVRQICCPSG